MNDPVKIRYDAARYVKHHTTIPSVRHRGWLMLSRRFQAWLASVNATRIGDVFLCSYYAGPDDWDVWMSEYDPHGRFPWWEIHERANGL